MSDEAEMRSNGTFGRLLVELGRVFEQGIWTDRGRAALLEYAELFSRLATALADKTVFQGGIERLIASGIEGQPPSRKHVALQPADVLRLLFESPPDLEYVDNQWRAATLLDRLPYDRSVHTKSMVHRLGRLGVNFHANYWIGSSHTRRDLARGTLYGLSVKRVKVVRYPAKFNGTTMFQYETNFDTDWRKNGKPANLCLGIAMLLLRPDMILPGQELVFSGELLSSDEGDFYPILCCSEEGRIFIDARNTSHFGGEQYSSVRIA